MPCHLDIHDLISNVKVLAAFLAMRVSLGPIHAPTQFQLEPSSVVLSGVVAFEPSMHSH